MKSFYLFFLLFFCVSGVFSQSILIQNKPDTIVVNKDEVISFLVEVCVPSNLVLYNLTNYAELNSDEKEILNSFLDGLIFQLYNPHYITQWGMGVHVLNLNSFTLDSDSVRFKYDTGRKQVTSFNIYNELDENRIYHFKADTCFVTDIYLRTPGIGGYFGLNLIYGQGRLGEKLLEKDFFLLNNKEINLFKGLIISDTVHVKIK